MVWGVGAPAAPPHRRATFDVVCGTLIWLMLDATEIAVRWGDGVTGSWRGRCAGVQSISGHVGANSAHHPLGPQNIGAT